MIGGALLLRTCGISLFLAGAMLVAGCTSKTQTNTPKTTSTGTSVGMLVKQGSANDPGTTVTGPGVGTGVGYVIGDSADKQNAVMAKAVLPAEMEPLADTTWTLMTMDPPSVAPTGTLMVTFWDDGRAVTTTALSGETSTVTEKYRIVGKTLILNKDDYIVNAPYTLAGDQLTINAPGVRMTFRKVVAPVKSSQ